jgi:excisionase family DNA binding protein
VSEPLVYDIAGTQVQLGGIGRTMVYALIKSGELRTVKIGRRTVVPRAAIVDYLDRLARQAAETDRVA